MGKTANGMGVEVYLYCISRFPHLATYPSSNSSHLFYKKRFYDGVRVHACLLRHIYITCIMNRITENVLFCRLVSRQSNIKDFTADAFLLFI